MLIPDVLCDLTPNMCILSFEVKCQLIYVVVSGIFGIVSANCVSQEIEAKNV